jgi:hypothetical protein
MSQQIVTSKHARKAASALTNGTRWLNNRALATFREVPGILEFGEDCIREDRVVCAQLLDICGYSEASEMLLSFNLKDAQ